MLTVTSELRSSYKLSVSFQKFRNETRKRSKDGEDSSFYDIDNILISITANIYLFFFFIETDYRLLTNIKQQLNGGRDIFYKKTRIYLIHNVSHNTLVFSLNVHFFIYYLLYNKL